MQEDSMRRNLFGRKGQSSTIKSKNAASAFMSLTAGKINTMVVIFTAYTAVSNK